MRSFVLGFFTALVLVAVANATYPYVRGFFGSGGGPVSSQDLNPAIKEYGTLRVELFGRGGPVPDVEVDLGKIGPNGPTGPMSAIVTDASGVALFEKVPVGTYDIFFNTTHFPRGFVVPGQPVTIAISRDQVTPKRIDLAPTP